MDQGRKWLKPKRFLGEQDISDLFSDELSDVPSESGDSDSDIGSEQESIVVTDNRSETIPRFDGHVSVKLLRS